MKTNSKASMNAEAYRVISELILRPSPAKPGKSHDELIWEEAKRYFLNCIDHNIQVTP